MPLQSNVFPSASYQHDTVPWLFAEQQLFTERQSLEIEASEHWVPVPGEPELDPPELEPEPLAPVPVLAGTSSPELLRQPDDVQVEPLSQ